MSIEATQALRSAQRKRFVEVRTRRWLGLHHLPFIGRKTLPDTVELSAKTISSQANKQLIKAGFWAGFSGVFGRICQLSASNTSIDEMSNLVGLTIEPWRQGSIANNIAAVPETLLTALKSPLKSALAWLGLYVGSTEALKLPKIAPLLDSLKSNKGFSQEIKNSLEVMIRRTASESKTMAAFYDSIISAITKRNTEIPESLGLFKLVLEANNLNINDFHRPNVLTKNGLTIMKPFLVSLSGGFSLFSAVQSLRRLQDFAILRFGKPLLNILTFGKVKA